MHDCKGNPLASGDTVLVPFTIKEVYTTDEFCNASMETVATMYPGTAKTFLTVNMKQVIRANEGDDTTYQRFEHPDGAVSIGAVDTSVPSVPEASSATKGNA